MTKKLALITTPWTDILQAQQGDPALRAKCLEMLVEKYHEPIRQFIQAALNIHQPSRVDDLVQGYFLEKFLRDSNRKAFFDTFDPAKGRLRNYLMATVKHYIFDQRDKGETDVSYSAFAKVHPDPLGGDRPDKASGTPEDVFYRAWARQIVDEAIEAFRLECLDHGKKDYFDVFVRHVLDHDAPGKPSHEDTAKALGMTVKRVENCLANAKNNFNKTLRTIVRATVADDSQVEQEMADLRKYLSRPI